MKEGVCLGRDGRHGLSMLACGRQQELARAESGVGRERAKATWPGRRVEQRRTERSSREMGAQADESREAGGGDGRKLTMGEEVIGDMTRGDEDDEEARRGCRGK